MKKVRVFVVLVLCFAIFNSVTVVFAEGAANADVAAVDAMGADGKWYCSLDSVDIADKSDLVSQMTIYEENEGWDYADFYDELDLMPDEVLELFAEAEWSISFGDASVNYYNQTHGTKATGLTYPRSHKIFVDRPASVAHEMGHFVAVNSRDIQINKDVLFADEAEEALDFLTRYEATTSADEYVAGYFAFLMTHQGHSECLAALAEVTPETYAFFSRLANDGWVDREPTSDLEGNSVQHFRAEAVFSNAHRGSCNPLAQTQMLRFMIWKNK